MINFKDEIKKYEPILELNDIEDSIHSTDMKGKRRFTFQQKKGRCQ